MPVAIVTGSAGLIGSESSKRLHAEGFTVVGIDNDPRAYFFGKDASTDGINEQLKAEFPNYLSRNADIRDFSAISAIFSEFGTTISLVIHTAAQPSHDWAAREPLTDFGVNATGTPPRCGEVYNIGGSRHSNCSMLEAIRLGEKMTGHQLDFS